MVAPVESSARELKAIESPGLIVAALGEMAIDRMFCPGPT
jgi:hypothetical protein